METRHMTIPETWAYYAEYEKRSRGIRSQGQKPRQYCTCPADCYASESDCRTCPSRGR